MATHQIHLIQAGQEDKIYTPAELKTKFAQHNLSCATQCSGKRREELHQYLRDIPQLPKSGCPIINQDWQGPFLKDILQSAGVDQSQISSGGEVLLLSAVEKGSRLGVKIPLEFALSDEAEIILALTMDGKEIPKSNGYPVRLVVPGAAGSRSIKQLEQIEIFFNNKDAPESSDISKTVGSDETKDKIYDGAPYTSIEGVIAVPDLPISSSTATEIRGYATPQGGDGPIEKAEISLDGGDSWETADLLPGGKWCWSLFSLACKLEPSSSVVCRVTDGGGNVFISKP